MDKKGFLPKVVISDTDDVENSGLKGRNVSFAKKDIDSLTGNRQSNLPNVDNYFDDDDDDDESVLSLPAELPPPPDGGWGWVIVAASFLCNMIVDGICYSFSPFLEEFSVYFGEPKGKVAWVSSLLAGFYLSAGPIVSALANKYGCRVICVTGGLISGIAYGLTVFAPSVTYLMITQGIIAGFGFGLMYLPAVVMVGYYFESKRAFATGIAVCGSGVGTFVFPPVMHLLIKNFGWRGANLIVAGVILNACWIGMLMRPLKVTKMKKKDLAQRLGKEKKAFMQSMSNQMMYGSTNSGIRNGDSAQMKAQRKLSNKDPGVQSQVNMSGYFTPTGTYAALPTIQEGKINQPPRKESGSMNKKIDEDSQSLLGKTNKATITAVGGRKSIESQVVNDCTTVPLNADDLDSIPIERRLSKIDILSHMKVVPATPQASYTNLKLLSSNDLRRSSKRTMSGSSYGDPENPNMLTRRNSSKKDMMIRPMSRQDVFYSGSILNLEEFKRTASMLTYRESVLNIQGTGATKEVIDVLDGAESVTKEKGGLCSEALCGTLTQMMDFSLLKNPVFLLIGVANVVGMLGFYTPFVYLPGAAVAKGVDKDKATVLVSIIGITNTIGRVLSGLIADIPRVNALFVNNICIILAGICVFLTPFAESYTSFVFLAVFFGLFVSAYISLTSIILVDLLGLSALTNAFGLLILFRGSASLVGPPLAGSIYDATESYDVSFMVSGVLLFACAGLHCVIPCVQKFCSCHEGPVRYTTNEEYLQENYDHYTSKNTGLSPDVHEGAGIVLDIKPKERKVSENGIPESDKQTSEI